MNQTPSTSSLGRDISSGFLVFLIALPLSMGIALASGFPALSGLITAIIGGLVTSFIGGAKLTIKGPAAGLIVVVLGAVTELQDPGDPLSGFKRALAVGVIAGGLQFLAGTFKFGRFASMIPVSVVHGMLAAIGIIIVSKQIHSALGVTPLAKTPANLLLEIPNSFAHLNPLISLIGALSFVIMLSQPKVQNVLRKAVPGAIIVLGISLLLGMVFDLKHPHEYTLFNHHYPLDPHFLVQLPGTLLDAIAFPDWSQILTLMSLKHVVIFFLVGSIESLLTVSAVDALDPEKHRSDPNRDLAALGIGNIAACMLGGLPMISEIVRSKANIDSGAKSKYANVFHGAFLLLFCLVFPALLKQLPLAALSGILVYVGTRLASPHEFAHSWELGPEQFFFFVLTCVVTVTVDLLVGVGAGLTAAVIFFLWSSPLREFIKIRLVTEPESSDELVIHVKSCALFSNYAQLGTCIEDESRHFKKITIDFSQAPVVEHTFLGKLEDSGREMSGTELEITGLSGHRALSRHRLATRIIREGAQS